LGSYDFEMDSAIKRSLDFALEVIFPKSCIGCEASGTLLCADCKNTISPAPDIEINSFAACAYKGLIQKMFVAVKLGKESRYASVLGNLLIEAINRNDLLVKIIDHSEITFIPMHWIKQNIRGFNQSGLLAKQIAKHFGKEPVKLLERPKFGLRQSSLDKNQRLENSKNLFRLSPKSTSVLGKDLVLVDDIRTTGATLEAAGKVLLAAGANSVFNMVVAQD
jgi:ComF family protein